MKHRTPGRCEPVMATAMAPVHAWRPRLKPLAAAVRRACFPVLLLGLVAGPVHAGPQGGQVSGGQGSISKPDGKTTNIHQQSHNMAIDWSSYNVGKDERVNYYQPSKNAHSLNRIYDQNPSRILGHINANGNITLVNPNGLFFGPSAQVNVNSLIASGHDIAVEDFMNGRYHFKAAPGQSGGMVVNQGVLQAATGGSINLIGGSVRNEGLIMANAGQVNLVAGDAITMDFDGDGLMRFRVDREVIENARGLDSAVSNSGDIIADGGSVLLSGRAAQDVFSHVVNNDGVVKAGRIENQGGRIVLAGSGGSQSSVINTGTLDASAGTPSPSTGEGGDGGEIEITADTIEHQGTIRADATGGDGGTIKLAAEYTNIVSGDAIISARALPSPLTGEGQDGGENSLSSPSTGEDQGGGEKGKGGSVQVLGDKVALLDNATIDVSGEHGGGEVLVGGDFQGRNPDVMNASRTYIGNGATIKADATTDGDGGRVIVWADETTRYYGDISARGGSDSGDGGFAEVSGKAYLDFRGLVDLTAAKGVVGTLLLDPADMTINDDAVDANIDGSGTPFEPNADNSILTWSSILTALGMADVFVTTDNGVGTQDGDITIAESANAQGNSGPYDSANNLTLTTASTGSIFVNAEIANAGSGGITFDSNSIDLNANVSTDGGNITFGDTLAGNVTLGNNILLSTGVGAGSLLFNGMLDATTAFTETLDLAAGTGNIDFNGIVGGTNEIGTVTINSAGTVDVDADFSIASLIANVGTITNFDSSGAKILTTDINSQTSGGVSITVTDDLIVGAINTSGAPGSSLLVGDDGGNSGAISLTGNISLTDNLAAAGGSGDGLLAVGGDAATITMDGPVALTGNVVVDTTGGAGELGDGNDAGITFNNTIDADSAANNRALSLDAGDAGITLADAVGSSQALGSLTLSADTTGGAGGLSITSNTISLDDDIDVVSNDQNIELFTDNLATGTGVSINAGVGDFAIAPSTLTNTIEICNANCAGTFDAAYDIGGFDNVTAASFTIGRTAHTGNITLQALAPAYPLAVENSGAGGISINGDYAGAGQNLSLTSGDGGITHAASNTITVDTLTLAATGSIDLLTDALAVTVTDTNGSDITLADNGTADTTYDITTGGAGGNVSITQSDSDALINQIDAGGTVSVAATNGAILDHADDTLVDISAGSLITLDAATGIGGPGPGDFRLELAAGSDADASLTGAGDILLAGLGALTLSDVDTTNGDADITAAGLLTATDVQTGNDGNIVLSSSAGADILLGTVNAGAGTVTVDSAGSINNGGGGLVTAGNVDLDAETGIGNGARLNTATTALSADTTAGAIDVTNNSTAALTVSSLTTDSAAINFSQIGTGSATFTTVTTSGANPITLAAEEGLSLDGALTTNGGMVSLNADSDADGGLFDLQSSGAITTGGGNLAITAADFDFDGSLTLGGGILDLIFTVAGDLCLGDATGGCQIALDNTDLATLTAATGDLDLDNGTNAIRTDSAQFGGINLDLTGGTIDDEDADVGLNNLATLTLISNGAIGGSSGGGDGLTVNADNVVVTETGGNAVTLTDTGVTATTYDIGTVNSVGNVALTQLANALTVGSIDAGTNGVTLEHDAAGSVNQTGGILADTLTLTGAGTTYTLTEATNNIATLDADTDTLAGLSYTDADAFDVAGIAVGGTATLSSASGADTVTQSGAILADTLTLTGAGTTYTLNDALNDIATLDADTDTLAALSYTDADAFDVAGIAVGGTATLSSASGADTVTQSSAILADTLMLTGAGTTYTLTEATNNIATLDADTDTLAALSYTDADALTVAGATAGGSISISNAAGDITLDGAITAGTTVDLSTAGSLVDANDGNTTVTGTTLTLLAADNIGAGGAGAIYTAADNLDLTATAGDIHIVEADAVTIDDATTGGFIDLANNAGDISVAGDMTATDSIDIAAVGDITLNAVTLDAGTSIDLRVDSDNGNAAILNLGDSTLNATTAINLAGGAGGDDTLVGQNVVNTWTIAGNDTGTLVNGNITDSDAQFDSFGNLTGGTDADAFEFNSGVGWGGILDGAVGTDTLDWTNYDTAVSVSLDATGATDGFDGSADNIGAFANIDVLTADTGVANSLAGADIDADWAFAGGQAGSYADNAATRTVAWNNFINLLGGSGADTFNVDIDHTGDLAGGAGADVFNLSGTGTVLTGNLDGGAGDDRFVFTGTATVTGSVDGGLGVDPDNGNDEIDFSGSDLVQRVTIDQDGGTIDGSKGTITDGPNDDGYNLDLVGAGFDNIDSLAGNNEGTIIGANVETWWNITGEDQGTFGNSFANIADNAFSGFVILAGAAADYFVFESIGQITDVIDGGGGTNTLLGSDGADVFDITGPANVTFMIGSLNTDLINIDNINGSPVGAAGFDSGADTFNIGADWVGTLAGADGNDVFNINNNVSGEISGDGGADTFNINISQAGTQSINGGDDADVFVFADGVTVAAGIDGGAGADTADWSGYTSAVTVNLNASGGVDGFNGSGVGSGFTNIEQVTGASGLNNTLNGTDFNADWTLNGGGAGEYLSTNVLNFVDFANLNGGDGVDTFAVNGAHSGNLNSAGGNDEFNFSANLTGTADGGSGDDSFILLNDSLIINAIAGGGGSDTLAVSNTATTFTLTANGQGTVDDGVAKSFSTIENLIGGNADDVFEVQAVHSGNLTGGDGADEFFLIGAGRINGLIDGGNPTTTPGDVLDASGATGSLTLTLGSSFTNIEEVIGNGTNGTLVGSSAPNDWQLGNSDSTLNGVIFNDFGTIRSGGGRNDFGSDGGFDADIVLAGRDNFWDYTAGDTLTTGNVTGSGSLTVGEPHAGPGNNLTVGGGDLILPDLSGLTGPLFIGGVVDPATTPLNNQSVTVNTNILTVSDVITTGGDIVLLGGQINLDASTMNVGGQMNFVATGTGCNGCANTGGNGDVVVNQAMTVNADSGLIIAAGGIQNSDNLTLDFNGGDFQLAVSEARQETSQPNQLSNAQGVALTAASNNFINALGLSVLETVVTFLNPALQLFALEDISFIDTGLFEEDLTLFGVIGEGIALSLAQCEELDGCAPGITIEEIDRLMESLQARIEELEQRLANGVDDGERARLETLLAGYREELAQFGAYREELQAFLTGPSEGSDLGDDLGDEFVPGQDDLDDAEPAAPSLMESVNTLARVLDKINQRIDFLESLRTDEARRQQLGERTGIDLGAENLNRIIENTRKEADFIETLMQQIIEDSQADLDATFSASLDGPASLDYIVGGTELRTGLLPGDSRWF